MLMLRCAKRLSLAGANATKVMATPVAISSGQQHRFASNRQFAVTSAISSSPQRLCKVLLPPLQSQSRCHASSKINDESALQRIYYGSLAPRMKAVKVFSLTTSIAGLLAQPVLMEQGMKLGGTGMAVLFCSFAGFFTFVTPLLLHFITKKYVTEIHYNPATEEYTATTISFLLRKIQTTFRVSDVNVPEVPGMFTSFVVDKRPLFVDPRLFEDPEHYVRMMGYDKPVDFKLEDPNASASKSIKETDVNKTKE